MEHKMPTPNNRPKVDLPQNGEPIRLKLLQQKPIEGKSSFGRYYLYITEQNGDGVERAFFASQDIHEKIQEFKLKAGDTFLLKNGENGKRNSYQIILESKTPENGKGTDHFKEIMQQSLRDAIEITQSMKEVPFQAEDLRSICSCLFIARTKAC